jgi:hypothetical protein
MMSDVIEFSEERVAKILWLFKEAIVRDVLASVIPDAFCGIQLRPVGRKLEHFHVAAVDFEPVVGFLFLVIRGVVLNQVDAVAAPVEGILVVGENESTNRETAWASFRLANLHLRCSIFNASHRCPV